MGKRLTESIKLIEKGYRQKVKKERWLETEPNFVNLKIDYSYKDCFHKLKVIVTDLLEKTETKKVTEITSIVPRGSTFLISSIKCPDCGSIIFLNKHWNAYFCCNGHKKKIFEIVKVKEKNESKN
ncbi:MAG: hypothetical protein ACTSWZ_05840 [Candidatus Heimdallarchaeaceae archaeon]